MAESVFNKGMEVEFCSSEPGFRGSWFEATIVGSISKKNKVMIEYKTLMKDEKGTKQLRESVDVVNLRPPAPREKNMSFKDSDEVDAYHNDAWWEGTVTKVLEGENARYKVYFRPSKEELEFGPEELRLHREWVGGSWEPPMELNAEVETQLVENKPEEKNQEPVVLPKSTRKTSVEKKLKEKSVEKNPKEKSAEKKSKEKSVEKKPEEKSVEKKPEEKSVEKKSKEKSVVKKPEEKSVEKKSKEKSVVKKPEEKSVEKKPKEKSVKKKPEETKQNNSAGQSKKRLKVEAEFPVGMKVEVKSDEEGFKGAWFAASIVKSIGKNKYLVEYETLMNDDETEHLKEEAQSVDIRPVPPEIQHTGKFKLYEEVDAMFNEAWWVGVVCKVGGEEESEYIVYFRESKEELKFKPSFLRIHQDWIDGKWIRSSESLLGK